jgi:hypothetical protein
MALLACPNCRRLLQFEARVCRGCERAVGFDPDALAFRCLDRGAQDACGNASYGVCNWLITDLHPSGLCLSCRCNAIIPDLSTPGVLERWRRIEDAKRRAIWGLIRLGLPLDGEPALAFRLLYDPAAEAGGPPVHPTGYLEGVVTLNLVEADDAARERIRLEMGEPYRTLVGHFRHELGHHFWGRLLAGSPHQEAFRKLFGDERADYAVAAEDYYASGGAADWSARFVSRYASMHPSEDFAETFAHFLHIVDTLAAIRDFALTLRPGPRPPLTVQGDPHASDTAALAAIWPTFAFALNSVNRAMGQPDLYPFGLSPMAVLKLDFINRLVAEASGRAPMGEGEQQGLEAVMAVLAPAADPADEHATIRRSAPKYGAN